jgi:hypothetical protein
MKNLLIYINPSKSFGENAEKLAKVQIDNMLELGWKREDIIFVTNFPYEYNGVKTKVVGDEYFFAPDPASLKCYAIAKLAENNFFEDELYWLHDLDHFQMLPITEQEIVDLMGDCDFGLCDYGRRLKYNCGSIFFRKSALDIFTKISDIMVKLRPSNPRCEEERSLMILTTNNLKWAFRSSVGAENSFEDAGRTDTEAVNRRIKRMPITYNFADYNAGSTYRMCDSNPKTAHFNPFMEKITASNPTGCKLQFFMGENRFKIVFMVPRLIDIFKKHGVA